MFNLRRRDLICAMGALPLFAVLPSSSYAAKRLQPKGVREIDISAYDTALLPREHGQLMRMKKPLVRRYPSRDHCMQMAAFFNQKEGLLIIGNDPLGGIADWEVIPGDKLSIKFYGAVPEVEVIKIEPTLAAAATKYRQWAMQQSWWRARIRQTKKLNFISVASSSSMKAERLHQENVIREVEGSIGVWFTQWRQYHFDRMYPDYTAKEPLGFARLLTSLQEKGALSFPYLNGLLWDKNFVTFNSTGVEVALRTETLDLMPYNRELDFLYYACPHSKTWQNYLCAARNAVRDSNGRPTSGVYLDMLAAAAPEPCWATNHGHEPGNPYSWQQGIRALLQQMNGAIMVEGCAEIYLDLVDYMLMHLYTDQADMVPLWTSVYGDQVQAVGWRLQVGAAPAQVEDALKRSHEFGALTTPWMTAESESALFRRNALYYRPNAPLIKEIISQ